MSPSWDARNTRRPRRGAVARRLADRRHPRGRDRGRLRPTAKPCRAFSNPRRRGPSGARRRRECTANNPEREREPRGIRARRSVPLSAVWLVRSAEFPGVEECGCHLAHRDRLGAVVLVSEPAGESHRPEADPAKVRTEGVDAERRWILERCYRRHPRRHVRQRSQLEFPHCVHQVVVGGGAVGEVRVPGTAEPRCRRVRTPRSPASRSRPVRADSTDRAVASR